MDKTTNPAIRVLPINVFSYMPGATPQSQCEVRESYLGVQIVHSSSEVCYGVLCIRGSGSGRELVYKIH